MSDIGIAILDIGTQDELNACYDSLPELENIIVVSNTKNTLPDCVRKQFNVGTQTATLRNWAISHFRINELKHFFFIASNIKIKDNNVFEDTVKIAETFGTWAMTGPELVTYSIEDDEKNISLSISEKLNHNFLYLFNGIVSNVGYFDERYYGGKNLEVIDYIIRLRDKKVYPPLNYNPIINCKIENQKKDDDNPFDLGNDNKTSLAYGYFLFKHKYIPSQNDPKSVEKDDLLKALEEIQNNYAKK